MTPQEFFEKRDNLLVKFAIKTSDFFKARDERLKVESELIDLRCAACEEFTPLRLTHAIEIKRNGRAHKCLVVRVLRIVESSDGGARVCVQLQHQNMSIEECSLACQPGQDWRYIATETANSQEDK